MRFARLVLSTFLFLIITVQSAHPDGCAGVTEIYEKPLGSHSLVAPATFAVNGYFLVPHIVQSNGQHDLVISRSTNGKTWESETATVNSGGATEIIEHAQGNSAFTFAANKTKLFGLVQVTSGCSSGSPCHKNLRLYSTTDGFNWQFVEEITPYDLPAFHDEIIAADSDNGYRIFWEWSINSRNFAVADDGTLSIAYYLGGDYIALDANKPYQKLAGGTAICTKSSDGIWHTAATLTTYNVQNLISGGNDSDPTYPFGVAATYLDGSLQYSGYANTGARWVFVFSAQDLQTNNTGLAMLWSTDGGKSFPNFEWVDEETNYNVCDCVPITGDSFLVAYVKIEPDWSDTELVYKTININPSGASLSDEAYLNSNWSNDTSCPWWQEPEDWCSWPNTDNRYDYWVRLAHNGKLSPSLSKVKAIWSASWDTSPYTVAAASYNVPLDQWTPPKLVAFGNCGGKMPTIAGKFDNLFIGTWGDPGNNKSFASQIGPRNDHKSSAFGISCGSSISGPITTFASNSVSHPPPSGCANVPDVWYSYWSPYNGWSGIGKKLGVEFYDGGNEEDAGYIALYESESPFRPWRLVDWRNTRIDGAFRLTPPIELGEGYYFIRVGSNATSSNQTITFTCFDKLVPIRN